MARTVRIDTVEVGQRFGCVAVVRDARNGRKLHTTGIKPYGFDAAAVESAESVCAERGWRVEAAS